jgi:hypothetical protein
MTLSFASIRTYAEEFNVSFGQMMMEMEKNKGGNPNLSHDVTGSPKYSDLGIERMRLIAGSWKTNANFP